ncbi:MAG: amidohydrolase family protein [Acidobacteriota bacterium]
MMKSNNIQNSKRLTATFKNNSISRRNFCRGMAAASAGIMASPPAFSNNHKYSRIDIHAHIGLPALRDDSLDTKRLLDWMDENNIEKAVVLALVSPEGFYYQISNEHVLETTRNHRDRLLPFVDIDPRQSYVDTRSTISERLKQYQDQGAVGVGEHKCGVPIDDPGNLEVFAAAGDLELPFLFHIDSERNTDKPGLPGLEKALQVAPNAVFIGHAQGWWASVSGNCRQEDLGVYPKGPVTSGGAIDRLFDTYPNLYGDLSAGSGNNAITRDMEWGREFLIRRADRLLFGTDCLGVGQNVPQLTSLEKFNLPDEVMKKICRSNAEKVLGL